MTASPMRFLFAAAATTFLAAAVPHARAEVNVVASIKPVHSLAAAVMEGVGEPALLVEGAGSPHSYALRPSQARLLEEAEIVFWIGEEMETFLAGALETIATQAEPVALIDTPGLTKVALREGGAFAKHDHGHDHEAHGHAGHDHAGHEEEGHEDGEEGHDHAHDAHDDHGDGTAIDAHIWLDPVNAAKIAQRMAAELSEADPENAATFAANAAALAEQLDALTAEIADTLAPVKDEGFIVFHDAYRYFEERFGLRAAGSITVSPDAMPGAERIAEIRQTVEAAGVACVFAEPQFVPRLIETVTEGMEARGGVLDPLGAALEDGADLYPALLRQMAASFRDCLSG